MEDEFIGELDSAEYLVGEIMLDNRGPRGPAGVGLQKLGYAFIQDLLHTAEAPFAVEGDVRTRLPNNGLGVFTSFANVPEGSVWYDPETNTFYGDESSDFFYYRVNLTIVPLVNNKTFTIDFDIGTPNKPFVQTVTLSRGAGVPSKHSFVIPIAVGSAMLQNGGSLNVWSEVPVEIYGINVLIHKAFSR